MKKKKLSSTWTYIIRGMLAVTPLVLTFLILRFLYIIIDRSIIGQIDDVFGTHVPGPWLGILVFLFVLWAIGIITSNMIGRQIFNVIEAISERIPIVKVIYQVGKQISSSLSPSGRQAFQRVVLLEYFHEGILNIGFVTGVMNDAETGEEILKVLIPKAPNPTAGFVVFVKASKVVDPKWTVEEGLKVVISGGIISPKEVSNLWKSPS